MELYRPILPDEYEQIESRRFEAFPPRPHQQPLFTALLSEIGAVEIARHMRVDTAEEPIVRVVRFHVEDSYIRQFPVQNADSPERSALWLPAEEIDILNQHLIGKIDTLDAFCPDHNARDTFFV